METSLKKTVTLHDDDPEDLHLFAGAWGAGTVFTSMALNVAFVVLTSNEFPDPEVFFLGHAPFAVAGLTGAYAMKFVERFRTTCERIGVPQKQRPGVRKMLWFWSLGRFLSKQRINGTTFYPARPYEDFARKGYWVTALSDRTSMNATDCNASIDIVVSHGKVKLETVIKPNQTKVWDLALQNTATLHDMNLSAREQKKLETGQTSGTSFIDKVKQYVSGSAA